ncbi:hypothetical protein AB0K02_16835 [Streptomyces sp. NPDC049597]|uniref:hypothetical protein n=1 Tax=Streptomyces sp. NPDC049597 TaxID=3155276 RepID=UPI00343BE64B
MAATRKSLTTAIAGVSAIAALAGCSQDGGVKAERAAGAGRVPAAQTTGATGDSLKGLSADQIAQKAVETTKAASSLRMKGAIEADGQRVSVDLAMDAKDNCTGRLGVNSGRADLRRLGEVLYMKGDEAFWRASLSRSGTASPDAGNSDTVIDLMKGRWIKMPARAVKEMQGVCDLDEMLAELGEKKADRTGLTLGEDSEIDGVPVATLVKKKGSQTTTAYVAREGKPYLLKVVKKGGGQPGTVALSDFDRPVKVTAPPANEVLDLGQLGGAQFGTGTGTDADLEPAGPGAAGADSGTEPGAATGTDGAADDTGTEGAGPAAGSDSGDAAFGSDSASGSGSAAETGSGADTGSRHGSGSVSGSGSGSGSVSGSGSASREGDGATTP